MMGVNKTWILLLIFMYSMWQTEAEVNLANHKLSGLIQWKYEKRPFCNAFTGCGRKRTSYPPYPVLKRNELEEKNYQNEELSEAGLSDIIDINAEPAVENVQKQIMSQAKIFEAIKEASKEIFRQKNKLKMRHQQEQQQQQQEQQQREKYEQQQQQDVERDEDAYKVEARRDNGN